MLKRTSPPGLTLQKIPFSSQASRSYLALPLRSEPFSYCPVELSRGFLRAQFSSFQDSFARLTHHHTFGWRNSKLSTKWQKTNKKLMHCVKKPRRSWLAPKGFWVDFLGKWLKQIGKSNLSNWIQGRTCNHFLEFCTWHEWFMDFDWLVASLKVINFCRMRIFKVPIFQN